MPGFGFGFAAGRAAKRRLAASVSLNALTLSASSAAENSAQDTVVGSVLGKTAGSSLALVDNAGGRFALDGSNRIVTGPTGLDYETGTSHTITIRETLAGATNSPNDTVLPITVTDVDEVAPVLSAPTGSATGGTTANIGVTSDEANGTLYWSILPAASAAPSAAAFIAGTTGGVATGSTASPNAGSNGFSPTGLTSETAYKAHFFQRDAANNNSNVVSSASFTTADVTAPTLSSPTDAANGSTGATLSVSTNEGNGTLYWYISTSATPPSATDLKAGTGSVAGGTQAVSGTGVQNVTGITGLTASTTYYAHFLHRDAANNDSGIVSGDGFTTSAAPAFDYIISVDADWDEANWPTAVKTSGGRIGVNVPAGASYAPTTISGISPSALLTIEPVTPGSWPRCERFGISACGNLKVTGLHFISTQWGSSPIEALTISGTATGDVDVRGNRMQGNYRGNVDAYDTFDPASNDIPEYANIHGVISGGAFTTLTIFNDYVGDLVADGTVALVAQNAGSGTGFSATMTVSGGRIVSTNLISGGSGYTDSSLRYNTIGWTGKTAFANQMPRGIGGTCNFPVGTTLHIRDNDIRFCVNGFKPSLTLTGSINVDNNSTDMCYMDSFAFGLTAASAPQSVTLNWNKVFRPFSRVGDPTDPHPDATQIWQGASLAAIPHIEIVGNEVLRGGSRANAGQAFFISDTNVAGQAYETHIAGNVGMLLAPNGASVSRGSNSFMFGNTIMPYDPANAEHTSTVQIQLSSATSTVAYGQSYIAKNVTEAVSVAAAAIPNVKIEDNTVTGLQTSTSAYSAVFADPTVPTTIAELRTKRQTIGSHADRGAYRDPLWINHATRSYDRTREPSFVRFPTKYNQSQSTDVYSAWCKLVGGPDSQLVTATNGAFQTATSVDTAGNATGVSADQTSATLARGTWIRAKVTTGSGFGSTAYTCTITVRGTYSFTFNAVTAALTSFTQADNAAAAYSTITSNLPNVTGVAKVLIAARFKVDAYVNNKDIVSDFNTTKLRFHYASNQWRLILGAGATLTGRWSMSQSAGTYRTVLIAVDLTKTLASDGLKCVQDYTELGLATSGNAFPSTGTTRFAKADLWPTSLGIFGSSNGGGNLIDGGMEWLWINTWDENGAMPDITDPLVFAAFSADRFGTDGSVGGVLPQPHWFLKGTLAEWNSTLVNGGSATGSNAVKAAGTYA